MKIFNFQLLGENAPADARLFFSVERFDYTKGIKEKLMAYKEYFKKYSDRIGKDVLYQVRFDLSLSSSHIKQKSWEIYISKDFM